MRDAAAELHNTLPLRAQVTDMNEESRIRTACLTVGMLGTNCYIMVNPDTGEAVVIDPGAQAERILRTVTQQNASVCAVLLTHGHFDHIGAVEDLRLDCGCPVYALEAEKEVLSSERMNLSSQFSSSMRIEADVWLHDTETIVCAGIQFEVIATPGHTPGGCCFYVKEGGLLFAGDTLFAGSAGRTDFPGGSMEELISSVKNRLFCLPDDTKVLPGHGGFSTIGYEKVNNPFF